MCWLSRRELALADLLLIFETTGGMLLEQGARARANGLVRRRGLTLAQDRLSPWTPLSSGSIKVEVLEHVAAEGHPAESTTLAAPGSRSCEHIAARSAGIEARGGASIAAAAQYR